MVLPLLQSLPVELVSPMVLLAFTLCPSSLLTGPSPQPRVLSSLGKSQAGKRPRPPEHRSVFSVISPVQSVPSGSFCSLQIQASPHLFFPSGLIWRHFFHQNGYSCKGLISLSWMELHNVDYGFALDCHGLHF